MSVPASAADHRFLPTRTVPLLGLPLAFNPGLGRLLRQNRFDIIIAGENFSHFPAVLTAQRAARQRRKPFVLWSEAIDTAYASGHFVSNAYRRWLYGRTTAFLAYSEAAKQFLRRRGAGAHRIFRGYQVVPAEQLPLAALSKADLGMAGKQVVLYAGYFNQRKGCPLLIEAFQQVAQENDRLVLVGDGPEKEHLEGLAMGDGRIQFPGYLEGPQKTSWYAAADLFVLPTLHDPWGLVVNEAMAFGLPIITTEAAGAAELVNGNGRVIPANNRPVLAAALNALLSDPDIRVTMGRRSRELIAPYTVTTARDAFLKVINHCLK